MPITLDDLNASEEVREHLGTACDFETSSGPGEPPCFTVDGAGTLTVIGRDGSGGEFAVAASSPRVLYFSSEGQGGILADDFDAFVALIVFCPYWPDLLKYSRHGSLDEMRRAAPWLKDYNLDPDSEEYASREFLRLAFGVKEPTDLVGALHRAASTPSGMRDPYGNPAQSLFGRFTIDDNPMFKRTSHA